MTRLIVDARSPAEFEHAHIPGALNIPLLDNEERRIIGTTYKQEGRNAAVDKGFELVGHKFGEMVRQVRALDPGDKLTVYCWRGGMRSGILSWVLTVAGFQVETLRGGYKSYRQRVLETLRLPRKIVVLGGRTGSGKTHVLQALLEAGEQVIDLEKIANHRGSAFGALGLPAQPSNEYFENLLAEEWQKLDADRVCWLENESRSIGSIKLPEAVYDSIRFSPVVQLEVPLDIRKRFILSDYGVFPREDLKACTLKIAKRLGGLRLQNSLHALEEGRMEDWLDEILVYYDKTYDYGNSLRAPGSIFNLTWEHGDTYASVASRLIDQSRKI